MQNNQNFFDKVNSALESIAEWAGKNTNLVLGAFVGLLLLGGIATAFNYKKKSNESAALADYAKLERDYTNWKMAQNPNPADKPANTPKVDPQDLFNKLVQFVENKGDTSASQMAILMASELAKDLNKEADVLSLVDKKLKLSGKSVLSALTLMKKGDFLANSDKCEDAVKVWKEVTDKKAWSYLHDFARLKSGLCFEQLSKFQDAEAQYDQIINAKDAKQDRWAYKEAQKFKRSLKWSQNQGS